MQKIFVLLLAFFLCNHSFSQARIGTKGIDSIENVINQTCKTAKYFIDSGKIYSEGSSKVIGSFKKAFYLNQVTLNLEMALFERDFYSDTSIYETFYYSCNKPITAYRITTVPKKDIPPAVRFLITGSTWEWKDDKLKLSADKIKTTALKLLEESKNYH